ncbi:hypothetical protein V6N13_060239 [Hibiscus sabdariffa]
MERLSHRISEEVHSGAWSPFRFSRNGSPLSHLFFADDLILYGHASLANAATIDYVLSDFSLYSGHRVSKQKTLLYFSSSTLSYLRDSICSKLGFPVVDSLGKYLGVPKSHNTFVFSSIHQSPTSTVQHNIAWAKHFGNSTTSPTSTNDALLTAPTIKWSPPPAPWICLNTDGSGILDGLTTTWQLGFEFVQVQSDCSKAISEISASNAYQNSSALIRSIHSLCQRAWNVEFIWIPGEANHAADCLTKSLPSSQLGLAVYTNPPDHIQLLLMRDADGIPYHRADSSSS